MNEESYTRPPVVAGMFYPEHEQELRHAVESLMAETAPAPKPGTLIGIVVPHAGYLYSGHTAARAFALLKNRHISTVVLVGPSHREYFDGVSVFSGASFKTPLGSVEVDAELRSELLKNVSDAAKFSCRTQSGAFAGSAASFFTACRARI